MAERDLADRLDETIDAIVARADATAALRDRDLAPLARVAADLRHYPRPDFKQSFGHSERRTNMTPASTMTTGSGATIREGFTTVTPYIRVAEAGLADFLRAGIRPAGDIQRTRRRWRHAAKCVWPTP